MLQAIGLEPQRLRMANLSSAMAHQFAETAASLTEAIQALGPSPLRRTPAAAAGEPTPAPVE